MTVALENSVFNTLKQAYYDRVASSRGGDPRTGTDWWEIALKHSWGNREVALIALTRFQDFLTSEENYTGKPDLKVVR